MKDTNYAHIYMRTNDWVANGKNQNTLRPTKWFYFSSMTLPYQKQMENRRQRERERLEVETKERNRERKKIWFELIMIHSEYFCSKMDMSHYYSVWVLFFSCNDSHVAAASRQLFTGLSGIQSVHQIENKTQTDNGGKKKQISGYTPQLILSFTYYN